MSVTRSTGIIIKDGSITRVDLNTSTAGSAVILKAVSGTNISVSGNGVDQGTGDVIFNLDIKQDVDFHGFKGTNLSTPATGASGDAINRNYVDAYLSKIGASKTITMDYTVLSTDKVILCDCTSGNIIITMNLFSEGLDFIFTKIDSSTNTITINFTGCLCSGQSSITIRYSNNSMHIRVNNSNYNIE